MAGAGRGPRAWTHLREVGCHPSGIMPPMPISTSDAAAAAAASAAAFAAAFALRMSSSPPSAVRSMAARLNLRDCRGGGARGRRGGRRGENSVGGLVDDGVRVATLVRANCCGAASTCLPARMRVRWAARFFFSHSARSSSVLSERINAAISPCRGWCVCA